MIGVYSIYGGEESHIRVLVGKPEGERLLGRPRLSWEDNIKIDPRKWYMGVWTGSMWLGIGTGGRHL